MLPGGVLLSNVVPYGHEWCFSNFILFSMLDARCSTIRRFWIVATYFAIAPTRISSSELKKR